MSLSEPSETRAKGIQTFQLPILEGGSAGPGPDSEGFAFQIFNGKYPPPACPEKELARMAEEILAAAEERRQHIERQAYEEGFRQGQKDGQEIGRRGLVEVILRFEKMLAALLEEKESLYRRWERDLVELTLLIGRKIVGRELMMQPEAIRDLVELGFRRLSDAEQLKLRVHPQDFELLKQYASKSWPPAVELAPDHTITPGGFRLESERGDLDGTLETRWEKVSQAINRGLGEADDRSP